jgi:hypothetical protein
VSLITPVEPYADESLAGFIVRAAARNHFRRPLAALEGTGIKSGKLGSLCSRDPSLADPIAVWAGTRNVETVASMFHQQVDGRIGWINWFGEPLRVINLQVDTRRVAPGTLKKLGYTKAVWALRPFSFDPSTKERLIDACPKCSRVLGWTRTHGVAYCDYCSRPEIFGEFTWPYPGLDLRDFPQEKIQDEDEEALDFITGLIDPSAKVKERSRKLVPEMWSSLSNGDVFEAGLSFASMFNQDHWDKRRQHIRRKPKAGEGWDWLTPRLLAIGGRALMGGQRGFEELADILRRDAEGKPREAKYGKLAEIGSLSVIDRSLCEAARKILGKATEACVTARRDPDMQPLQKLAQKHGIQRNALKLLAETGVVPTVKYEAAKAPILMSARALDPLIREMRASISHARAASEIGVNEMYIEELSRCGLLTRVEGPVLKLMMTEACYTRASVETLKQNIWKQVRQNPPPDCLHLRSALRACNVRSVPWVALVQAVLDGRLEVFAVKCIEKLHSLADRLGVRDAAHLSSLLSGMPSTAAEWIGNSTASEILGVNETAVWMLAKIGAIKKHDDAPRYLHFRGIEVERFASQMIFTPEIVRTGQFKTYRKASAWLRQEGIAPRFELKTGGWKGYSRAEVESGLKCRVVAKPKRPPTRPKEWGYGPNSSKGKLAAARELSDKSRVGYATAAIILGVTIRMVRSLVAHGLLATSGDVTPFHRADVEALAKRFVFTPETMRLTGYLTFRRLMNWLINAGIEPLYHFRASGHVFDRDAVEDLVARTEFVGGQHSHWVKRKLLNIVERGNSVHQASIVCGVSYATAKKWASSQREAGSP